MTAGSPTKLMILFAIPLLLGAVFDLMYSLADAIVLGRFVSAEALASVGAATSTTGMIIMIGHGLTISVSILVSQAWGAKDEARLRRTMGHAFGLCALVSLCLGALSVCLARPLMLLLRTPENIIDGSVLYIQILCGAGIARMFYNTSAAVLRSIGDSRTPLVFLIVCSVLNIVLDVLFVAVFGMAIAGVAWATIVSQAISAALCCAYMWKKYPELRFGMAQLRFDRALAWDFGRIALPTAAREMMLTGGQMVISAVVNSFGSDVVAAYTVGGKVEQIAIILLSQVECAFAIYVGQNYGAKRFDRIELGRKRALMLSGSLTALSMAVLFAFGRPFALMFVNAEETQVLAAAVKMIRIEAAFLPAFSVICLYNSMLKSMGIVMPTLVSSMTELFSKVGFAILLDALLGYTGVWFASPLGWVLGFMVSAGYYHFANWKKKAFT